MGKVVLVLGVVGLMDIALGRTLTELMKGPDHIALERKFRVRSDIYHHDLAPNTDAQGVWGRHLYPVHTNALGFKDAKVRQVPLRAEGWRILFMGDSFTEGSGVEYPQTFVGRIGEALKSEGVDVLNGAVASYAPSIYHRKIQHLLEDKKLHFDEVVVFLDISDIDDDLRFYRVDEEGRVVDRDEVKEVKMSTGRTDLSYRLKQNSLLLTLADVIKDRIVGQGWKSAPRSKVEKYMYISPRVTWTFDAADYEAVGRPGLDAAAEGMDRLHALLKARGIKLSVVVYPWPAQILEHDHPNHHTLYWKRWCEAREVPYLDLFGLFVNEQDPMDVLEAAFIEWDAHFNPRGHEMVAEAFLDFWSRPAP